MAIFPIDGFALSSKMGSQSSPRLIDLKTPPTAVLTYKTSSLTGEIATSVILPPVFRGPINAQSLP